MNTQTTLTGVCTTYGQTPPAPLPTLLALLNGADKRLSGTRAAYGLSGWRKPWAPAWGIVAMGLHSGVNNNHKLGPVVLTCPRIAPVS